MKKIIMLSLMALFCIVSFRLSAANPADYLPSQSPTVVYVNAHRIFNLPWMEEVLKSNEESAQSHQEFEAFRKKYQLDRKDLFPGAAYIAGNETDYALYAQTNITAAKLEQILSAEAKAKSQELQYTTSKIADRKAFIVTKLKKDKVEHRIGIVYLAADVVMIFEHGKGEAELIKQSSGNCALLKKIDQQAVVSGAMLNPKAQSPVKSMEGKLNLTGADQRGLDIFFNTVFDKPETAQQYGMQIQMMVPMFAGMLFPNDQKLGAEVIKSFSAVVKDNQLTLKYQINAQIIEAVIKYFDNPANRPDLKPKGKKNTNPAEKKRP